MTDIFSRVEQFIDEAAPEVAVFEALALDIFRFQYERNLPYRAYCESCGVSPERIESCDDIPAVVTSAFKEIELTWIPPLERTAVFHSSGTTQHRPSRQFHSQRTLQVYEKSVTRWFQPNVIPDRSKANFLVLSPNGNQAPNSSLVHMWETVAKACSERPAAFCGRAARDGSWTIDFDPVESALEFFMTEAEPVIVCGTAFSFVELCDWISSNGKRLRFPTGSRVFETGGYKGRSRVVPKDQLHQMISRSLSIAETHIIGEYGMSELSSQAYDRKPGETGDRLFRYPPWVRTTIISPETSEIVPDGETGLLRVTDLANVSSVMVIQTEDVARKKGDGFELLGRASHAEARGCSLMHEKS